MSKIIYTGGHLEPNDSRYDGAQYHPIASAPPAPPGALLSAPILIANQVIPNNIWTPIASQTLVIPVTGEWLLELTALLDMVPIFSSIGFNTSNVAIPSNFVFNIPLSGTELITVTLPNIFTLLAGAHTFWLWAISFGGAGATISQTDSNFLKGWLAQP